MKSIKKRFKLILAEINFSATELYEICADLTMLSEMQKVADAILAAEQRLRLEVSDLNKQEFREAIADSSSLAELDDMVDIDVISNLEERFFSELGDQSESGLGEFLQQLLAKIEKPYAKILAEIQQLHSLLEEQSDF
jgi:hypothetical protein